ncbi:hypothetical protein CDIK_2647 [Cucumispora dikerogammari]|nr:hypothetical protein CDIK_2647 [Cucumispora dikerogammari]
MSFYSLSNTTENNMYNNSSNMNNLLIDSSLKCSLSNKTFNELLTEHQAINNELPFVIAKVRVKYNKHIVNNSKAQHRDFRNLSNNDKACELSSQGVILQSDTKNSGLRVLNASDSIVNRHAFKEEAGTGENSKYPENLIFSAKQLSRELFENRISITYKIRMRPTKKLK